MRRKRGARPVLSEESFRAIAEYTYDWESWTGADGRTQWVNAAVARMTGYTVAECLRMRRYPLPIVHPSDRARVATALRDASRRGSGNDLPFRIATKSGGQRWGAMSWQSIYGRDGAWLGYRTSVRDVTERQQAEEALREAKRQAEEASQLKSEFLAMVSHELRTPLQSILGYTQLLSDGTASAQDGAPRRYLQMLGAQSETLLKLVDDILDFSALQADRMRIERARFDVAEAAQTAVAAIAPLAEAKRLVVRCEVEPAARLTVLGDGRRLAQVLLNLLGNAVKFTNRGEIVLSVEMAPAGARGTMLRFAVTDTGIGIARHVLPKLFEPFAQADTSIRRRYGGSGLGLAISDKLVRLMGGEMRASSRPGRGSKFELTLPATGARPSRQRTAHPAHRPAPNRAKRATSPAHARILVVDDNQASRELAVELVHHLGFAADTAATGAAALKAAARTNYDLILMDVHLPGMDGLAVTRRLRERLGAHRPRIVAMTANVLGENRQACMQAGMDGFLGKPVRLAELEELLGGITPARARPRVTLAADRLNELRTIRDRRGEPLLDRVIAAARAEVPEKLAAAERALGAGDLDALARAAHDLLGHARTVGARATVRAAEALEVAARAGNRSACGTKLATLRRSADAFLTALAQAAAQTS